MAKRRFLACRPATASGPAPPVERDPASAKATKSGLAGAIVGVAALPGLRLAGRTARLRPTQQEQKGGGATVSRRAEVPLLKRRTRMPGAHLPHGAPGAHCLRCRSAFLAGVKASGACRAVCAQSVGLRRAHSGHDLTITAGSVVPAVSGASGAAGASGVHPTGARWTRLAKRVRARRALPGCDR